MTTSSAHLTSLLAFIALVLLSPSCRAAHDGQNGEEGDQAREGVVSYTEDYSKVPLPPHTYRLTLPHASPLEDYRVEIVPALPNTNPTHTSLDGRFVPSTQVDVFSSYRYQHGEGIISAFDKPIEGLDPKPFLYGEPLLLPFRGNKELAITTNDSVRVVYRIWRAMGKATKVSPDSVARKLPRKRGYTAYVITAPERHKGNSPDYYIELIPCIRKKVDCNIHVLSGKFELDMEAEGLNLPYIFKSDGKTMSTRMGCPDARMEEKLIRHMGLVVLRNAGEAVTVYIPDRFTLLTRYYRPEGKRELLTSDKQPQRNLSAQVDGDQR